MNAFVFTSEQYDRLLEAVHEIRDMIKTRKTSPDEFIDNNDLMRKFRISRRTAQAWRDEGRIAYSQIGHKIYYRLADIEKLLATTYSKTIPNLTK